VRRLPHLPPETPSSVVDQASCPYLPRFFLPAYRGLDGRPTEAVRGAPWPWRGLRPRSQAAPHVAFDSTASPAD